MELELREAGYFPFITLPREVELCGDSCCWLARGGIFIRLSIFSPHGGFVYGVYHNKHIIHHDGVGPKEAGYPLFRKTIIHL